MDGVQRVARLAVYDIIMVAGKVCRVVLMAHHILLDDAEGNQPVGVDLHILDFTAQDRGFRGFCSKTDTHVQYGIGMDGPQLLGGQVNQYPRRAVGLFRAPTATFHVDQQLLSGLPTCGL